MYQTAFPVCNVTVVVPYGFTSIGTVFYGCTKMTSISLPSSIVSIGYQSFKFCSSLVAISLPSSVSSIDDYAFYGCSSLLTISLPARVSSIGLYAFYGCSSLFTISLPSSVNINDGAFIDCSSLQCINTTSTSAFNAVVDSCQGTCHNPQICAGTK